MLKLVKTDTEVSEGEEDVLDGLNLDKYWEREDKALITIAKREIILMNNSTTLTEGKTSFNTKAIEAFQVFIREKELGHVDNPELQAAAPYILLYYVDKFFSNLLRIELDKNGEFIIIDKNQDPANRGLHLLRHLIRQWMESSAIVPEIPENILYSIFLTE